MKIQFDAQQQYQKDAVGAVVDLFKGQPMEESFFHSEMSQLDGALPINGQLVVGNQLALAEENLLKNLQQIQKRSNIDTSKDLQGKNFSVEMETGTGKTYVYLRTIHELNRQYGFSKFIIVVPSIAVKEGVIKNLQITKEHFDTLYEHPEMDFYVWDSKKKALARRFATANSLQIMIVNIDSIAGKGRIMHKESDVGIPAHFLQAARPIVIVDEPQNMETPLRRQAIKELNPLCTLRYSATHRELYNLVYRLDPVQAYDEGLVKKIEVDSVREEGAENNAFIEVLEVTMRGNTPKAKLKFKANSANGVKGVQKWVEVEDNLYELSDERSMYKNGFIVSEIDAGEGLIRFSNHLYLYEGQSNGVNRDELMKFQIRSTVQNHFEKELKLKARDIKVLSLFFIDKVENYRVYQGDTFSNGKIAKWFEEAFQEVKQNPKYKKLHEFEAKEVHSGYFSQDKKKRFKDTRGNTIADNDTYELIMRDKERLLDEKEPVRFIFSHSALREGWDNPNVFQICTLNETRAEIKKRQEIGRGLRLPVDASGQRVFDSDVNILTLTVNEHYDDFAQALQTEIEEEAGVDFSGRIKPKRDRVTLKPQTKALNNVHFKKIWNSINQKTAYQVEYSTKKLVERSIKELKKSVKVKSPRLIRTKTNLQMDAEGVHANIVTSHAKTISSKKNKVPDVLTYLQNKTKLSKETIFNIVSGAKLEKEILKNPQQFLDQAAKIIQDQMKSLMVDGIKYQKLSGKKWEMKLFKEKEIETYLSDLYEVQNRDKTLYASVLIDSGVESTFAKEMDHREDVKFYFKLPNWFKIPTPIGNYNPDWAIVFKKDKIIYFVAETKSGGERRESEDLKIECGRKHFDLFKGVQYEKVTVEDGSSDIDGLMD